MWPFFSSDTAENGPTRRALIALDYGERVRMRDFTACVPGRRPELVALRAGQDEDTSTSLATFAPNAMQACRSLLRVASATPRRSLLMKLPDLPAPSRASFA